MHFSSRQDWSPDCGPCLCSNQQHFILKDCQNFMKYSNFYLIRCYLLLLLVTFGPLIHHQDWLCIEILLHEDSKTCFVQTIRDIFQRTPIIKYCYVLVNKLKIRRLPGSWTRNFSVLTDGVVVVCANLLNISTLETREVAFQVKMSFIFNKIIIRTYLIM